MATITDNGFPTLATLASRLGPDGKIEQNIAEVLTKDLPLLEDIPWVEANQATGHLLTSRHALPGVATAWRRFNQGVASDKSYTSQFTESMGMMEKQCQVDEKLALASGDVAAFRFGEAKAFIEALNEEFSRAVWYENVTSNPEKIHGLTARYAATSGYTASSYVTKSTVANSNCHSIWLINWGVDTIFGIYPRGSRAGLQQIDEGVVRVAESATSTATFRAYSETFRWDAGIAVKDYRHACRHQWDPDDDADSEKTLYLEMQAMVNRVKSTQNARFYMDRTSIAKVGAQLLSNSADPLKYVQINGGLVPTYLGIPIRVTDTLVAESAIS